MIVARLSSLGTKRKSPQTQRVEDFVVKTQHIVVPVDCADADLPIARFQRRHLLRDLAHRGDDQAPGQLCF